VGRWTISHEEVFMKLKEEKRILTRVEFYKRFLKFRVDNGGHMGDWYVGITDNIERRLFQEHQVDPKSGVFDYAESKSALVARGVEKFFVDTVKMDGEPGGGDASSRIVYIYRKTPTTKP
jgi:hypothetical protein